VLGHHFYFIIHIPFSSSNNYSSQDASLESVQKVSSILQTFQLSQTQVRTVIVKILNNLFQRTYMPTRNSFRVLNTVDLPLIWRKNILTFQKQLAVSSSNYLAHTLKTLLWIFKWHWPSKSTQHEVKNSALHKHNWRVIKPVWRGKLPNMEIFKQYHAFHFVCKIRSTYQFAVKHTVGVRAVRGYCLTVVQSLEM